MLPHHRLLLRTPLCIDLVWLAHVKYSSFLTCMLYVWPCFSFSARLLPAQKSKLFVRSFFGSRGKSATPPQQRVLQLLCFRSDGFFASICFKASSVASLTTYSEGWFFLYVSVISCRSMRLVRMEYTISSDQGKLIL